MIRKQQLLTMMLVIASYSAAAQQHTENESNTSISLKRNEIGLFSLIQMGSTETAPEVVLGIQYKKWIQPNIAWHLMAGVSPFTEMYKPIVLGAVDSQTINVKYRNADVNRVFIGTGVEVQRHFYKRVQLFAALDLYAGYGSGTFQTQITQVSIANGEWQNGYPLGTVTTERLKSGFINLVPSVGGKIVFDKFSFGTALSFANAGIHYEKLEDYDAFIMPYFNQLSSYNLQLFGHYRF